MCEQDEPGQFEGLRKPLFAEDLHPEQKGGVKPLPKGLFVTRTGVVRSETPAVTDRGISVRGIRMVIVL